MKAASAVTLVLILLSSFLLELHHLDHAAIKPLDEVFHAIVARNFLKHPLTPTLVDRQYLPSDEDDWLVSHIWLHKPPMAMWQIAGSFALLGVNTLALRLPSAILAALAVWLTYCIGVQLLDRTSALVAAGMQAFNPVILMLVHGYVFSDHVDISLLFWTELSIFFLLRAMRGGRRIDFIFCGIAQGAAVLSKTYPGLLVTALAVLVWLLPARLGEEGQSRVTGKRLLLIFGSTALVVLPWAIYSAARFPAQFANEQLSILHHLNENVENWAAPWDRVVFGYWISIFYVYYPAVIAATIVVGIRVFQKRQIGPALVLAWAAVVAIPNLLATSKTMSATLIGWPAAWLLLGYLVSLASQGDQFALGTWLYCMLAAILWLHRDFIPSQGWGYEPGGFAIIMREHLWVLGHVAMALLVGAAFGAVPSFSLAWRRIFVTISGAAMLLLAVWWWNGNHPPGYVRTAWMVTSHPAEKPNFAAIGRFAAHLPDRAVFLVDEKDRFDNKRIEFVTDRSCYALDGHDWREPARELVAAGALPYLISAEARPLPIVCEDPADGQTIYACNPAARDAAR